MQEIRRRARGLLHAAPASDLDRSVAYDGGIAYLRAGGLTLRYALMSIAAHYFLHVGEIVTIRSRIGRPVTDVPRWAGCWSKADSVVRG
jgi:hypothetical protein